MRRITTDICGVYHVPGIVWTLELGLVSGSNDANTLNSTNAVQKGDVKHAINCGDSRDRLQSKKVKVSDLAFLLKSLVVKL